MRVRSLMQTYRTLLASVEYARLPEGLDYDEVRAAQYKDNVNKMLLYVLSYSRSSCRT